MPRKYPEFVIRDVSRHGQERFYYRRGTGPRYRLPPMHDKEFMEKYTEIHKKTDEELGQCTPVYKISGPEQRLVPRRRKFQKRGFMTFDQYLGEILRSAKTRARHKGVPFGIDAELVRQMAEEQKYSCALTGIRFFTPAQVQARIAPFVPSLDRIVPKLGYVPGNVRLVCFAVNAMMLDWGEDVFAFVSDAYRRERNRTRDRTAPKNGTKSMPLEGVVRSRSLAQ